MQMTGPSSSKQTKREPPADWSTDKSGAFSQLDATVFSWSLHCSQKPEELQIPTVVVNAHTCKHKQAPTA